MTATATDINVWLERDFSEWINQKTDWRAEYDASSRKFIFTNEDHDDVIDIVLSEYEFSELQLIHDETQRSEIDITPYSQHLSHTFKIEPNQIFTVLMSNEQTVNIKYSDRIMNFRLSNQTIEGELTSELSLRLIYILISNDFQIDFSPIFENDLLSFFSEITYLKVNFSEAPSLDEVQKINIILNQLYIFNDRALNHPVIPMGLVQHTSLKHLKLKIIDLPPETSPPSAPRPMKLTLRDSEALIYFLISKAHEDFRFIYLDLYHVLEYHFDLAAVYSIKIKIESALNNPDMYFNNEKVSKFTKELKETLISKKNNYSEINSLYLTLKLIDFKHAFKMTATSNESETKFTLKLPKVQSNNVHHLQELKIELHTSNEKWFLNGQEVVLDKILDEIKKRIYSIRNAITHSKQEFDWRLKPYSKEIIELQKYDLDLITRCSEQVIEYFTDTSF